MAPRKRWVPVVRAVAAAVLGYTAIVVLTTLGFVHWLDGADLYRGGWALQAKGALVAVVAGLAGGGLAALIGGCRPVLHAAAVLLFLVIDTLYVLFVFPRTAPLWFELLGSLALMAATLAGGWAVGTVRRLSAADGGTRSKPPRPEPRDTL